ncbi:hypothetical protein P7K49_035148 [Saguinus oedipus]|uniref:Uncharacterized protein n=1 Tax=Saguinus oedipus TaxID=9490 RepID=A0ABQ9TXA7_SAGOE|nr:hypothetical protein P7K49_035148 [Saguinus oedipus]
MQQEGFPQADGFFEKGGGNLQLVCVAGQHHGTANGLNGSELCTAHAREIQHHGQPPNAARDVNGSALQTVRDSQGSPAGNGSAPRTALPVSFRTPGSSCQNGSTPRAAPQRRRTVPPSTAASQDRLCWDYSSIMNSPANIHQNPGRLMAEWFSTMGSPQPRRTACAGTSPASRRAPMD